MVFGGVIAAIENLASFNRAMAVWRAQTNMTKELKWTRVSKGRYAEYASLVDLFFERITSRRVHFKALILDTHDRAFHVFSGGDKEAGLYKFYYQFLLRNFASYPRFYQCGMRVFVDERTAIDNPLGLLHVILNQGFRKRFYFTQRNPVESIEPIDSKQSQLLQVADVIMGAIGFQNNGMHERPDANTAKVDLAKYIARKAGLRDLTKPTAYTRANLSIHRWKWGPAADA
jgi:hypothetical protein